MKNTEVLTLEQFRNLNKCKNIRSRFLYSMYNLDFYTINNNLIIGVKRNEI